MSTGNCVLCGRQLAKPLARVDRDAAYQFACATCGVFEVGVGEVKAKVFEDRDLTPVAHRLSALARASTVPIRIDRAMRERAKAGTPPEKTVSEKIEKMIMWFAGRSTEFGQEVPSRANTDYPFAWCRGPNEWTRLVFHLCDDLKWITAGRPTGDREDDYHFGVVVTGKGWEWLSERPRAAGSKAFIAMAFAPELDDVKAAIHQAIEGAGYDPLRVDDDHYSGGVMDRIITHIRDSKFIVADFTKNRGGVYYEAGVAFGLGIDVVNVSDAECLKDGAPEGVRLHFDVRHLAFVEWKAGQLEEFVDRLTARIVAIHGRGPRSST